jgi:hypothetical protein
MSLESVDPVLGRVQVVRPAVEIQLLLPAEPAANEHETQALDQVYAQSDEHNPMVDAVWLASAGMLVHDVVKDTLAASEEEDEEKEDAPPRKDKARSPQREQG